MTKPEGPAQEPLNTPAKSEAAREAFWAFCDTHAINGAARIEVGASTERLDDIVATFIADGVIPATPDPSQPAGARESDEYVGATLFRQQRDWLIAECARVGVTVNVAIGAPLESAYRLVNDAAQQTAAFELKWWQNAINSVRASLEQYPNAGGDIGIMQAVKDIVAKTTAAKDAELDKLRTWVNCGGVPTGKQCSSPIEFGHDIYGPFIGDGAGNFICEFHAWKATERERDSLREHSDALISALDRWMANNDDENAWDQMIAAQEELVKAVKDGQQ